MTLCTGIHESFGSILHSRLGTLYAAYVLAAFPSADGISICPRRTAASAALHRAPIIAIILVLCTVYSFVGLRRLTAGGIKIFLDDTIIYLTVLRSMQMRTAGGIAFGQLLLDYPLLAWMVRLGFPLVTLLELLAPLCLFNSSFRRFWLVIMVPFHFATGLFMGIWFIQNSILVGMLMVDWQGIARHVRRYFQPIDPSTVAVDPQGLRAA